MARNGPFGPAGARPPVRRHPADDPFALPPQGRQPQYADPPPPPPPAPGHGQGQGYHFPPEPEPSFGFNGQQQAPSLDQYQPGAPQDIYGQPQWGQPDPSAYDLGSYMPSSQQGYPPNGAQGYPPTGAQGYPQGGGHPFPPGGGGQAYAPDGTQPYPPNGGQPYPPPAAPQPYAPNGAPAFSHVPHASDPFAEGGDPYAPMDPPPFHRAAAQHQPYQQEGYAEPEGEYGAEGDYEQEYEEEDAEPGRGRRWVFIVAALIGAIGVGGALAFTYKSFVAPNGGRVPLVKADPNLKVRPENGALPSGDRRLQGRLGEDTPQRAASAIAESQEDSNAGDEQGGPRRVRTIPITPGGGPPGIQVSQPPPVQASAQPMVPGIMLDNMGPRPQPTPAAAPPQRVSIGEPPPQRQSPPEAEEPPSPPPARRAAPERETARPPPVVVKNAAATRAASPPETRAAPPPATTGAGYVAVLSSQKTRMDALKAFADLQQKYSEALSGRVPDVQEANLGAKGVWYRVVVGPPGSRSAANDVCGQLKSAGYGHCWVNAY